MADNAFEWAKQRPGCWRVNPVHKEEEARVVLSETFLFKNQVGSGMETEGSFQTEDTWWKIKPVTKLFSSFSLFSF